MNSQDMQASKLNKVQLTDVMEDRRQDNYNRSKATPVCRRQTVPDRDANNARMYRPNAISIQ